ncbi:MAG: hypothetical protein AAGL17_21840, partial [Cyanobacteria bacterium J06576_12]
SFILELTKTLVAEQQLTTLMVTHSMQQALDLGDRTIMLHEGAIALDISGKARDGLTVSDLLAAFADQAKGIGKCSKSRNVDVIADDALLLG